MEGKGRPVETCTEGGRRKRWRRKCVRLNRWRSDGKTGYNNGRKTTGRKMSNQDKTHKGLRKEKVSA